jgi:hypothetical protein
LSILENATLIADKQGKIVAVGADAKLEVWLFASSI